MLSTAVSPSISTSPSCCRHVCFLMPTGLSLMRAVSPFMPSVSFFMLICPFLMLPPLLLVLHGAGGTGGRGTLLQGPTILYAELAFFLCCACPFLMLHGALSIHLHVSPSISMSPILLSTCLFSYAHGSFSYACGFSFYAIRVFFANLSFPYAAPSSSSAPQRRWDGGEGHPFTRPDLFGAILHAELAFFLAAFVLFLCFMGRFPSISMSLPPSPCLPSCRRHVCFPNLTFF